MPRRVRMEDEEGIPPRRLSANPPSQEPNPYSEEEAPMSPPRRQRGVNMPNSPGVQMGESGRQELTIKGKRYIRDGSWWVDAEALAPYGYDPDSAPPEVVERSRMSYSQGLNKARRLSVADYNDANWQGLAQAAGYGDWRESRRKVMQAYQADPVRFWQMAANGGGGDLTKQPTADDLERFSHWLWITDPANQQEAMKAQNNPPKGAPPPPPEVDPYDPNAKFLQVPGTQPKPAISPAGDTIGAPMTIGNNTSRPTSMTTRPPTTMRPAGSTRPPEPAPNAYTNRLTPKPAPSPTGPMDPLQQSIGAPTMKPKSPVMQKSWGY